MAKTKGMKENDSKGPRKLCKGSLEQGLYFSFC